MNTLILLIIGIPIIEIYLFIKIGTQIGAFNTILLIFDQNFNNCPLNHEENKRMNFERPKELKTKEPLVITVGTRTSVGIPITVKDNIVEMKLSIPKLFVYSTS